MSSSRHGAFWLVLTVARSCTGRIRAAIKARSVWLSGWPPCLCRVTGRWVSASQGKGCSVHSPPNPGLGSYPRASSGTRCPSRTECILLAFLCLAVAPELSSARKGQRTSCMPPTPVLLRAPPSCSEFCAFRKTCSARPRSITPRAADLVPAPPDWRCGGLGTGHALSGQSVPLWDEWSRGDAPTAEGTGPCLPTSSHPICGA